MDIKSRWQSLPDRNKQAIRELRSLGSIITSTMDSLVASQINSSAGFQGRVNCLKCLSEALKGLERLAQGCWGFDIDDNKHTWWLSPKNCECPKLDNTDPMFFGSGRIISSSCPIHGDLDAQHRAVRDREFIEDCLQPLELCLTNSDNTESMTVCGYFCNYSIHADDIPLNYKRLRIRHRDDDDSVPSTLEEAVSVNYFGDFIVSGTEWPTIQSAGYWVIEDYNFIS